MDASVCAFFVKPLVRACFRCVNVGFRRQTIRPAAVVAKVVAKPLIGLRLSRSTKGSAMPRPRKGILHTGARPVVVRTAG